ncbi:phage putative head morphogenesis protein, SPP1 gp7 family [Persephonella hydrogeniphila]|uniref:Phage putative head morphogenesis protein, SPP1 gp7 family n=1 Tax=Persephonella hydrogeniphila TaxID=198703 RepID=A0A285NE38_9AQUI|nr:phage minor head protein [Persephonella hydrogeniphila]SNZ07754.1 phage putative head morphogenesis protein, SPP1 gp7 family [Persephonella hydrogeniphila]
MKFEEAIDHLKSMIPMKKEEFNKLSAHLKYRAFTIAKVSSEDLINKVKQIYTKTLEEGKTKQETLQEVHKILPNLTANHLSIHYNNNVMIAYNAGRIKHFKDNKAVQYLIYNAILDGHTTNLCRKLHGTVKPKDDSFWDKFYPPNHHNCRSIVYPVHKSQLGKKISYVKADEETGKLQKEEIKIKPSKLNPKEILKDKILSQEFQFRGNPEKAIYEIPDSLIDRAIKYGIIEDLIKTAKDYFCKIKLSTEDECEENIKRIFIKSKESFEDFIQEVLSANFKPKGRLKPIGWLSKDLRELIKQKGLNPKTPLIVINDKRIIHSIRDIKAVKGASLSIEELKKLPDILENPEAVIFDKIHQNIIYVSSSIEEPKKNKIVVEVNYKLKKLKKLIKQEPEFKDILEVYQELENVDNINVVKTMGKLKKEDLIQHIKSREYEVLKGKIH